MNTHPFWKLAALTLSLSAPAALASEWRDEGNLRRDDVESEEEREQSAEDRGFNLGLRVGYGLPVGNAVGAPDGGEAGKLSDAVSGVIPLQLDVGYSFNSNLALGAYFQYGLGMLAEDCVDGADCSVRQLRFGVNLTYHFLPGAKLRPWLGLGVGYEKLNVTASASEAGESIDITTSIHGFEFASVQGGLDYRINERFSVGPYLMVTAAMYSTTSISVDSSIDSPIFDEMEESEGIDDKAVHLWPMAGVRMQFHF
ncbi:porin family protein [Myxococcus stipitatus]|uniref:outer membrane beta-barrel protein n=1 Tax=Myxococcus stipitatus TaxID=83455 RepID=UPI001F42BAEC|nr:outer membrane beta-barrel protein [Myxococcus stipitatus]MCE9667730.1 porin family protein [Myxococcus stipitatus]